MLGLPLQVIAHDWRWMLICSYATMTLLVALQNRRSIARASAPKLLALPDPSGWVAVILEQLIVAGGPDGGGSVDLGSPVAAQDPKRNNGIGIFVSSRMKPRTSSIHPMTTADTMNSKSLRKRLAAGDDPRGRGAPAFFSTPQISWHAAHSSGTGRSCTERSPVDPWHGRTTRKAEAGEGPRRETHRGRKGENTGIGPGSPKRTREMLPTRDGVEGSSGARLQLPDASPVARHAATTSRRIR
ncbi:unnamed protein product [Diplocarpon coronariae]|nr:hypothetical protein JHW43_004754 [Diplocarpon mali]